MLFRNPGFSIAVADVCCWFKASGSCCRSCLGSEQPRAVAVDALTAVGTFLDFQKAKCISPKMASILILIIVSVCIYQTGMLKRPWLIFIGG